MNCSITSNSWMKLKPSSHFILQLILSSTTVINSSHNTRLFQKFKKQHSHPTQKTKPKATRIRFPPQPPIHSSTQHLTTPQLSPTSTMTPVELLAQVKDGNYTLKHIQDISMLYIHHYLLSLNFTMCDAQGTALQTLPPTWNTSPNMVFLRYTRNGSGVITCKFGRKENGTMDMQLKSPTTAPSASSSSSVTPLPASISKTFKFKTFSKEQFAGVVNSTSQINGIEQIVANASAVVHDLGTNLGLMVELLEGNGVTPSVIATPAPVTTTTTTATETKPSQQPAQYFLQHNVEITPAQTPAHDEPMMARSPHGNNPMSKTTNTTTTTAASPLPITTTASIKNHIIGDPASSLSPQTTSPQQQKQSATPQPIELVLPTINKGFSLPTDDDQKEQQKSLPSSSSSTSMTHDEHRAAAVKAPTLPTSPILPNNGNKNDTPHRPDPFNPLQQQSQPPGQAPLPFDPYSGQINPGQMTDRGFRSGDPGAFNGGYNDPFQGGNLMGPGQFRSGGGGNNGPLGSPPGAPGSFPPPHGARFDPYGPGPGMGDPNNDHLRRPGNNPQPPRRGNGPNNGNFNGYL